MIVINSHFECLIRQLSVMNIRASKRRLMVIEYLCNRNNHPNVEQIYTHMKKNIPSLSKATVYNTLHTLEKAGLLKKLDIENHTSRFDIMLEDHGHFVCEQCGTIDNFDIEMEPLLPIEFEDHEVQQRNVFYKGICRGCLQKNKNDRKNEKEDNK